MKISLSKISFKLKIKKNIFLNSLKILNFIEKIIHFFFSHQKGWQSDFLLLAAPSNPAQIKK